jgi:hypothetical protein
MAPVVSGGATLFWLWPLKPRSTTGLPEPGVVVEVLDVLEVVDEDVVVVGAVVEVVDVEVVDVEVVEVEVVDVEVVDEDVVVVGAVVEVVDVEVVEVEVVEVEVVEVEEVVVVGRVVVVVRCLDGASWTSAALAAP